MVGTCRYIIGALYGGYMKVHYACACTHWCLSDTHVV